MSKIKTVLSSIWFIFVVSLVGWWWIYAMKTLVVDQGPEMINKHRMFMWEGSILLAALVLGGGALIVLSDRDEKRHNQLKTFFATFSHDIKTSIARLRLQAEVLEEDNETLKNPVLKRLINDISRLDLQLENSLLLSSPAADKLLLEKLTLSKIIGSLRLSWTDLEFKVHRDAEILADSRAITSVLRNLVQNAVLHGEATVIEISAKDLGGSRVEICVRDNGKGFSGDPNRLGNEMMNARHGESNGIGLYLGKRLVRKMKGQIRFENAEPGLKATLQLEGRVL